MPGTQQPMFIRLLIVIGGGLCTGCALFDLTGGTRNSSPEEYVAPKLPALNIPEQTIVLHVTLVDRLRDDPLINHQLWQELDTVGVVPPILRESLQVNGIRAGLNGVGTSPALQELWSQVQADKRHDGWRPWVQEYRLNLLPGLETEVLVREPLSAFRLKLQQPEGNTEDVDVQQPRGIIKLRPEPLREGWIRLHVIPEIHHGATRLRHIASERGWMLQAGQLILRRQGWQFTVDLHARDTMVLGPTTEAAEETLGGFFFLRNEQGQVVQRLVILHLEKLGKL